MYIIHNIYIYVLSALETWLGPTSAFDNSQIKKKKKNWNGMDLRAQSAICNVWNRELLYVCVFDILSPAAFWYKQCYPSLLPTVPTCH